jgi:hypothetical protein
MLPRSTLKLAAIVALLGACTQQGGNTANEAVEDAANIVTLPKLPVPAPAMNRAALLAAVAQAASAAAGGLDDGQAQRELDGKPFEVRIRFGCSGPTEVPDEKAMSWRFDDAKRTLRLRAAPDISIDQPLPAAIAGDAFEAAEGFWVPRPWLLQPGCPVVPPPAPVQPPEAPTATNKTGMNKAGTTKVATKAPASKAAAGTGPAAQEPSAIAHHRVAIAQFFSETDSRTLRRDGRPYEATKALAEGQAPSAQGYDLVLSGRLKRLPNGRVIACKVEQPDRPPQCIVSADFDRVWIERPDTKESLAEWNAGG